MPQIWAQITVPITIAPIVTSLSFPQAILSEKTIVLSRMILHLFLLMNLLVIFISFNMEMSREMKDHIFIKLLCVFITLTVVPFLWVCM